MKPKSDDGYVNRALRFLDAHDLMLEVGTNRDHFASVWGLALQSTALLFQLSKDHPGVARAMAKTQTLWPVLRGFAKNDPNAFNYVRAIGLGSEVVRIDTRSNMQSIASCIAVEIVEKAGRRWKAAQDFFGRVVSCKKSDDVVRLRKYYKTLPRVKPTRKTFRDWRPFYAECFNKAWLKVGKSSEIPTPADDGRKNYFRKHVLQSIRTFLPGD